MRLVKTLACLMAALLMSGTLVAQTTYYVSNDGNDSNSGTSQNTPWKTIQKVNSQSFSAGDKILFQRGDSWRETLSLTSSGNSSQFISYGSYGEGERPRILGSQLITSWDPVDGYPNIWRSSNTVPNPHDAFMSEIWFIEHDGSVTWGKHEQRSNNWSSNDFSVLSSLTEEYNTTWVGPSSASGNMYIYCSEDPDTRYASIEVPVRNIIIELNNREWVEIDGLELRYCLETHINELYGPTDYIEGLRVTNCEIGYSGIKDGSNMYGIENRHSHTYIAYNNIHDCGRRSISLVMYDTSPISIQEDVVIEHNHLYNGYHTTGVDINNIGQHIIRDIVIRYNIIEGDPDAILDDENTIDVDEGDPRSMGIFCANQGFGSSDVGHVRIYGNIFKYMTSRAVAVESTHDVEIYNNDFFHFNPTLSGVRAFVYTGENGTGFQMSAITVKNNIFVEDLPPFNEEGLSCIKINYEDRGELTIDNNLYYSPNFDDRLMRVNYGPQHYSLNQWEDYKADLSYDLNSPDPANPLFVDPANGDFSLQPGSPAIDAGTAVPWEMTDINGAPRDLNQPSLGAVEFSSPDPSAAEITSFRFTELNITPVIDKVLHEIRAEVPYGTSISHLTPEFRISYGASVTPASGLAQDFSKTVNYTVTSSDKSTSVTWPVYVTMANPSTENSILSFIMQEQTNPAVINATAHSIAIEVAYGTDITGLAPVLTVSPGASVSPASGALVNFTNPVSYTVTAQDGVSKQAWTVTVSVSEEMSAPVVQLTYPASAYRHFVFSVDASSTYDPDGDPLNFLWDLPSGFSCNSIYDNHISILPGNELLAGSYTFGLHVSDGTNTVNKTFIIEMTEFNPEVNDQAIIGVEASSEETGNGPDNLIDDNLDTRWAAEGVNEWVVLELSQEVALSYLTIAFYRGTERTAYLDVYASRDGESWDLVIKDISSCGFSDAFQGFEVEDQAKGETEYKFIKLVGLMNSINEWNSYNEVVVYGKAANGETGITENASRTMSIFPNPAIDQVTIDSPVDGELSIISLSGKVLHKESIFTGNHILNLDLESGVYLVRITGENSRALTGKLVIR